MATAMADAAADIAANGLTMGLECRHCLRLALGREPDQARPYDKYHGLALALRRRLVDDGLRTERRYREHGVKRVNYLSLEFLTGRALQNNVSRGKLPWKRTGLMKTGRTPVRPGVETT